MLINLLLVGALLFGGYLSSKLYRDVFTPLCVYVSIWCVCLLLFHLRIFVDYYALRLKFGLIIAASIMSFVTGCLLAGRNKQPRARSVANLRRFEIAIKVLIIFSFCGVILFAIRMDSIYGLATYFVDPSLLRSDFQNWPRIGMLASLVLLNYPLAMCCLIHVLQTKRLRWFTCLGFFLACTQSYLLTDRVTLVVFCITGTFVWAYLNGWQRISGTLLIKMGFVVGLTIAYFLGIGNFFGKLISGDSHQWEVQYLSRSSELDLLFSNPYIYATGSFVTMQQAMDDVRGHMWGTRTFFPIARVLYAIDALKHRPEEASMDFYFVPIPYNTYTYLFAFYEDFGLAGVLFFPFLLGYLETRLYLSMKAEPTLFSVSGTASLMAVNIFTVFIALPSTILIWYYFIVLFAISKWCSRSVALPAAALRHA
jgi:oligosaccharide repeat unit polymerase